MKIIDGSKIALDIKNKIKSSLKNYKNKPGLVFILVGKHIPSHTYVKMKKKACELVGINSFIEELSESIKEEDLIAKIRSFNNDKKIDGILVQLPLPEHIDPVNVIMSIDPNKDVDGLHPINVGKMLIGDTTGFFPCTPLGIKTMLVKSNVKISEKHVVVVGRSNLVGKPIAAMLVQKEKDCNATVTIAHSRSENLKSITSTADILIVAIGKAHFIKKDMVKKGAVVIDVGINKITTKDNKSIIVGDVDYDNVAPLCSYISPVPKGVGPMTIAMLLQNTVKSFMKKNK